MSDEQAAANGDEAVFDAARAGEVAGVTAALDAGLAVDSRNDSGDSLLMLAAYHCRDAVVTELLARGASPDLANAKGQRPLAGVCWKGSVPIARALLEHGADVEAGGVGMTPLMLAAMCGHREVVRLLLEHGADPAARSGNGQCARDLAANIKSEPVLAMLDEALAGRGDV